MFNVQHISNLKIFLARVDLKGVEAAAFQEILAEILNQEKELNSQKDEKKGTPDEVPISGGTSAKNK